MRERPILFSAPMVRAILEGRKTQTRRVVKPQLDLGHYLYWQEMPPLNGRTRYRRVGADYPDTEKDDGIVCPYGSPGDQLWVRETFAQWPTCDLVRGGRFGMTAYRAGKPVLVPPPEKGVPLDQWPREWRDDTKPESVRWRPSIHMPRSASRITLEVTGVRVERLQAISGKDACAEGVDLDFHDSWHPSNQCAAFRQLWESINGAGSWDANPWVWVVEFRRTRVARG